jgi:hypothetical protein
LFCPFAGLQRAFAGLIHRFADLQRAFVGFQIHFLRRVSCNWR